MRPPFQLRGRGASPEALARQERPQWEGWIAQARAEAPSQFVPNGYVVGAFQAALSAVVRAEAFADGVQAAISVGHDTDTVGSIAGALLGARFGRTAIATDWVQALHGWPGMTASDLAALAEAIASRPG